MKFIRPEDSTRTVHEVDDADEARITQFKDEGFVVVKADEQPAQQEQPVADEHPAAE